MADTRHNYTQVPATQIREGVYRSMAYTDRLMITVMDFVNGPWEEPDPYHSHPHEQITYVAGGEVIFYCDDRPEQHLKEGDVIAIPSGVKHTIKVLTKKVRLIDSFTPVRKDFLT